MIGVFRSIDFIIKHLAGSIPEKWLSCANNLKSTQHRCKEAQSVQRRIGKKYRYSLFVTNLCLLTDEVWVFYRRRADAENLILELKDDFAAHGFCLKNFQPTDATFRFVIMACNLMSLFLQLALQPATHGTLNTLKFLSTYALQQETGSPGRAARKCERYLYPSKN